MKKGLLATTALVGASIAMMGVAGIGVAEAAKPKVSVKGKLQFTAAFIDQDQEGLSSSKNAINSVSTDRGFATLTDSEIQIIGQGKTDAGMNWRATLEIEADGSTGGGDVSRRVADDTHLRLWGSWGMLMLGAIDGAGDKMSMNNGKYAYGTGGSNGLWPAYVNRKSVSNRFLTSPKGRDSSDSAKIVYYTPRMSGFQAGVGWAADRGDEGAERSGDASATASGTDQNNFFEVGVNYSGKFSGVSVKTSYTGFFSDNEDDSVNDVESHAFHAILGYGGFKVGGMWLTDGDHSRPKTDTNDDSTGWDVGVSYNKGPIGLSYTYYVSEVEVANSSTDEEMEQTIHIVGATYTLGKGVSILAEYFHYETETDVAADSADENDADVLIIGIKTKF